MRGSISRRRFTLAAASLLWVGGAARAEETLTVVSSGGFAAAYKALAPEFERRTGVRLVSEWGPSMGTTVNSVPSRLARGEAIDVVIMVGYAFDALLAGGKALADGHATVARSLIGVAVRAGAPRPDISTPDALRRTLLAARSIAYSDSASGVYIQNEMLKTLGVAEAVAGKARMIPAEPVGAVVARGEAEIGFQQISELKPIPGIDLVGPLPPALQKATLYAAGVLAGSPRAETARKLVAFLASPDAAPAIRDSGLEPVGDGR